MSSCKVGAHSLLAFAVTRDNGPDPPVMQISPYRALHAVADDNLAITEVPPITVAVVDFEGGGRLTCNLTDREPEETVAGMDVEMTFRWMHYVGGVHSYWWKCRPIRM